MELLKSLMEGQGIVECALIVAVVVFIIWITVTGTGIGESVTNVFSEVVPAIENAKN